MFATTQHTGRCAVPSRHPVLAIVRRNGVAHEATTHSFTVQYVASGFGAGPCHGRCEVVCAVCHGSDGVGVMPGVRDLTDPGGPLSKADDALFRSIRDGVQSMEGAMAMPARGGNPALRDSDIYLLIDYLRRNFGSDEHAALTPPGEKP